MSGWANSTRSSRLPRDWPKIRARILRRDPDCTCRGETEGCTTHPGRPCGLRSTEVDHLVRGDNHHDDNLAGKCSACHQAKTIAERPKPPNRRRPPERHPGLR